MNTFRCLLAVVLGTLSLYSCAQKPTLPSKESNQQTERHTGKAEQNLTRAIELAKTATENYFDPSGTVLSRYYNPFTHERSSEKASVWMYTSSIEATNTILSSLIKGKDLGHRELYDKYFAYFNDLLARLYKNLEYYAGTFTLTSYTQTREWTVYAVDRSGEPGGANVTGILNVYDDQMWLVRELLASYSITGDTKYLEQAEYLTAYILDGWDCTLDDQGCHNGGITWGPGYVTKHACSNGPMISALVELHEVYKGKSDQTTMSYIAPNGERKRTSKNKATYYLDYAKAIYTYQKEHLLNERGVYDDMMGGSTSGEVQYEMVGGKRYRAHTPLPDRIGPAISYNSGTMLSGGAWLYRATAEPAYLQDATALAGNSFEEFATLGSVVPDHYTFDIRGFRNWFDCVLLRGYCDVVPHAPEVAKYLGAFQDNLDYAYTNFLYSHMLPTSLLAGWHKSNLTKNNVEAMFTYAFATEYALLAYHEWSK